ncbi:FAD-binding domain-containing protein [Athelia psychrophila]|uniref:FAD-binding domain-containing protein n=1 Tax=Athelia psychrophila TaxID=1759441 RepID=A0A166M114_9AGAM|nr:FAD-binding domain-containing protein [Fibularhizoctonia sp. CBS 109695]
MTVSTCFFLVLALSTLSAAAASSCFFGQTCFPSLSTLAAFNVSTGGKLYSEVPIGAPCYSTSSSYNQTACDEVTSNYHTVQWRIDSFSRFVASPAAPHFHKTCGVADSCLVPPVNSSAICGQGSVPLYSVHATTSSDVQKYVQFATEFNLRIVVKNTGHDYQGRSSSWDGFALWTHGIRGITRNQSFVPEGCSTTPQDSVTVASGEQWNAVYQFADDAGVLIVGGDCDTVGAGGGWLLGGGHSVLSPSYGLGVDNLLQAEIVTPDGELQTVSECSNPDLFWAIRGGGAGTWGVLTQVTYKVYPFVPLYAVSIGKSNSSMQENAQLISALANITPNLHDMGVGSFMEVFPTELIFFALLPGGSLANFEAAFQPIVTLLPAGAVTFSNFSTFLGFYAATYGAAPELQVLTIAGFPFAPSSRLIPRHYFENDTQGLTSAIQNGQLALGAEAASQPIQILMDSPAPALNVGNTSVTPVWYSSLWHVVYTVAWNTTTPLASQKSVVKAVHDAADVLRAYAPDGAAYPNEADIYEPDHEQAFWGAANAARLAAIKKEVDPLNFFQVWQGIGWDGAEDEKYKCYAELNPGGIELDILWVPGVELDL